MFLCTQMGLGHEEGFGAPCLKCKEKCEGFELHYWRKICRNCKCGQEEHDIPSSNEEDRKVGKLFEDTKYTTLIEKLKNDPVYKRNVMILSSPVPAKKNITIDTVTYEWAPPVQSQALARQYMQMLPKEKQPVAGSEGAQYRKKQLAKQLPAHDQDPSKCHELSPSEVKHMEQFVKKYKREALGVGDVKLPGDVEVRAPDENNLKNGGGRGTSSAVGTMEKSPNRKASQYSCYHCKLNMKEGDPAVYAERAGYDKLWHPGCFTCCTCSELLVDMIYFWKNGNLYCGRHYCDSERPRCAGCDECCFISQQICQGCHNAIDPEVQRVTYNNFNWHATQECFLCSCCSKCLIGQKFISVAGMLFCSVACKEKMMS
ncbi:Testin [Lonchura striata]|uniref:Testin n=1 Tax=Lonchura striata TaxID=40157 RepID=A0A218UDB7_9PASE|nr:Testin [Lonchura striata domestica]